MVIHKKNINILFVAFEFPPLNGAGVQRSLKFVKYLHEFGITPVVITIKEADGPLVMKGHLIDHSFDAEIPAGTVIKRIHCQSPLPPANKIALWSKMYFSITETFKDTWRPGLEEALPDIVREYNPCAIYISLPPFAMAPLWLNILRKYKLPLIADFRDAWSQWCVSPNGSYLHYQKKLLLEKEILSRADRVICTSNETMSDMQRVHPSVNKNKFSVITNGYDGELEWNQLHRIPEAGKIRIGYVGSFYYSPKSRAQIFTPWWRKPPHRMLNYVPRKEDWLYRSPYFFLKTIRHLLDEMPSLENRLEIHFAGNNPDWLQEQIKLFGLTDLCRHHGYLQHDAVLAFQKECDILLITSSKVIGGRDYSIAGKTFEYFTIGIPVLAFVCEGAQKDILTETGISLVCDPDNVKESAGKIKRLLAGDLILDPDTTAIRKYHRRLLTEKLAGIIKERCN